MDNMVPVLGHISANDLGQGSMYYVQACLMLVEIMLLGCSSQNCICSLLWHTPRLYRMIELSCMRE